MLKAALVGLVLSVSGLANAGLIYDNGSITDTSSDGYCSSGPSSCGGGNWIIFDDFTLTDSVILSAIEYTDFFNVGNTSNYLSTNWSIWANNPTLGGSALFSGNNVATVAPTALTGTPYTFTLNNLSLNLTAGSYWLSTSNVVDSNAITTYAFTNLGNAIQYDSSTFIQNLRNDRAFRLFGSPTSVPEPSTLAIFALGIIGLASRRFKKQ